MLIILINSILDLVFLALNNLDFEKYTLYPEM